MPTIIDSLLVSLGFKIDAQGLQGFAKMADQAKHGMLAIGAAATGAVYGIERLVKHTAERMGGIQDFSEQMGLSARSVDALGRVAREHESSLESMEGAMRTIGTMAGMSAQGFKRATMSFERFGLKATDVHKQVKPVEQILGEIADKLEKMPSVGQRMALGARFGLDPAMVKLLSEGRANFERLREEALKANPFFEKDYEAAEQTEKAFRAAGDSVTRLKDRLAVGLMPTVNALLRKFIAWTADEKNIAKLRDGINKVVDVVGLLARNLDKIIALLAILYAHKYGTMFMEWGNSFMHLVKQMRNGASAAESLKLGLLALKGILTGGILTLILLIAEDLWVFYRGGTSVTGWMMTKFPHAVDVMKQALVVLGAAFLALSLSSGPVGVFAFAIGEIALAAIQMRDAWDPVMQWFEEAWDSLADKAAKFINMLDAPLRLWAKVFGLDISLKEDHRAARNAEYKATYGPIQKHEAEMRERRSLRGGSMLPGMGVLGGLVPGLGFGMRPIATGSHVSTNVSTVTTGDLHFHLDGSRLGASDADKLFRNFSERLKSRGILPRERDAARAGTRDQQPGRAI